MSVHQVKGAKSSRLTMTGSDCDSVAMNNSAERGRHRNSVSKEHRRRTSSEGPRLTIMLITVSCTFLVFTCPNNITLIYTYLFNLQQTVILLTHFAISEFQNRIKCLSAS